MSSSKADKMIEQIRRKRTAAEVFVFGETEGTPAVEEKDIKGSEEKPNMNINNDINDKDDNVNNNNNIIIDNKDINNNENPADSIEDVDESNNCKTLDLLAQIYNDKKENKRTLKGFYLEQDIVRALEKVKKKFGKGFQSDFVNQVLRQELESAGFLQSRKK
ncbi:hypothetical protein [Brevibacillus marinus]|uniref:hypothetical protein n=1 Tax=Brevibacillus marinus TaxID=2496837 RepID=UPI000F81DE18|nr:hypothetical protein [Brevibacillus marinus]